MNLIASELGLFALAGHDDGAAGGIDFDRVLERGFGRDAKNRGQHFDHVIVGVVVVVQKHHVEKGGKLILLLGRFCVAVSGLEVVRGILFYRC